MPDVRQEVIDVLDIVADETRRPTFQLDGLPFRVHATYSRDGIQWRLDRDMPGDFFADVKIAAG